MINTTPEENRATALARLQSLVLAEIGLEVWERKWGKQI